MSSLISEQFILFWSFDWASSSILFLFQVNYFFSGIWNSSSIVGSLIKSSSCSGSRNYELSVFAKDFISGVISSWITLVSVITSNFDSFIIEDCKVDVLSLFSDLSFGFLVYILTAFLAGGILFFGVLRFASALLVQ